LGLEGQDNYAGKTTTIRCTCAVWASID
jgi:hypothetical protein